MKMVNPKQLYLSILVCVFVINALTHTLVHAAQTIPGVHRLEEGITAYEHGEYDNAVFKLEMAVYQIPVEEKEKLWDAHFYLGLSYCLTGNNDEAGKQFIKAQGIIKNKSPDEHRHSPKIVKLFEESLKEVEPVTAGTYTDSITGMELVLVKGGCFDMGDNFGDGEKDEKPVHEVCVDDFYIGKYEVTQGQWEDVMGNNPSRFKNGNNYPVERVSWNDILEFIKKLNNKTGKNYRLPTEAEWEYAARSGGKREKWAGTSNKSELGRYAWYRDNSERKIHPVGQKKPNELGIYDMAGNVREWCSDWYISDYYNNSQSHNPKGPSSGKRKVLRGGSWGSLPGIMRSTFRSRVKAGFWWGNPNGLRLVLSAQ